MAKRRTTTITFFLIFTMLTGFLSASKVLIAGYLTPAPAEATEPVNASTPTVGGIKLRYGGQTNHSNNDGYFSFEKTHNKNELRIIITPKTGYDLLKHTVSHQTLHTEPPPMAVYLLEKKQGIPASIPALETKSTEESATKDPHATPQEETIKNAAPAVDDSNQWYWQVTAQGDSVPDQKISSRDLIIEADPQHFYLQDGSTHMAQENNQFILPHGLITILTTPPAPAIELEDRYSQSVDAEVQSDTTNGSDGSESPPVARRIF